MSLERPDTQQTKVDVLQIKTQLSREFLDARQGWLGNYVRHVAQAALDAMQADETVAFEAAVVTSELVANADEHGRALTEFVLAHSTPRETDLESVYVVASNPAQDATSTPGTDHRGKLAAKGANNTVESGRGLVMTNVYTGGNWGQRNTVDYDGRQEIITFAVLSPSSASSEISAFYEDAA
jgi:hypothetical protein